MSHDSPNSTEENYAASLDFDRTESERMKREESMTVDQYIAMKKELQRAYWISKTDEAAFCNDETLLESRPTAKQIQSTIQSWKAFPRYKKGGYVSGTLDDVLMQVLYAATRDYESGQVRDSLMAIYSGWSQEDLDKIFQGLGDAAFVKKAEADFPLGAQFVKGEITLEEARQILEEKRRGYNTEITEEDEKSGLSYLKKADSIFSMLLDQHNGTSVHRYREEVKNRLKRRLEAHPDELEKVICSLVDADEKGLPEQLFHELSAPLSEIFPISTELIDRRRLELRRFGSDLFQLMGDLSASTNSKFSQTLVEKIRQRLLRDPSEAFELQRICLGISDGFMSIPKTVILQLEGMIFQTTGKLALEKTDEVM